MVPGNSCTSACGSHVAESCERCLRGRRMRAVQQQQHPVPPGMQHTIAMACLLTHRLTHRRHTVAGMVVVLVAYQQTDQHRSHFLLLYAVPHGGSHQATPKTRLIVVYTRSVCPKTSSRRAACASVTGHVLLVGIGSQWIGMRTLTVIRSKQSCRRVDPHTC